MKALILAAGYATRLYPLTKETPKALLEVAGKSILERLLEKIGVIPEVDHVYIVTNSRFSQVFESWVENYTYDRPLTVIDDGTTSNENLLGSIFYIQYAIEKERIEDDLMILAGDNLFDFELCDFARFFEGTNADVITAYRVKDVSMRRRLGIAELDSSGRVLSFQEKPEEPRSQWAVPALYIYQQETLPLISMYLHQGNNPDAPGRFVPWLIQHKPVFAFRFDGRWYDIGTLESYQEAQAVFASGLVPR